MFIVVAQYVILQLKGKRAIILTVKTMDFPARMSYRESKNFELPEQAVKKAPAKQTAAKAINTDSDLFNFFII